MQKFPPGEDDRLAEDILRKLHLRDPDHLLLRWGDTHRGGTPQVDRWFAEPFPETLTWTLEQDEDRPPVPDARMDQVPPRAPVRCEVATLVRAGSEWRIARWEGGGGLGEVAANLAAPKEEIKSALFSALLAEIPIALLLTALGAWLLSTFATRPLHRLRESMSTITPSALDRRLPPVSEDREFKDLVQAYNTMLERLQRSFEQASRFSADAAHELKTPLTILRGRIEQAKRKASDDAVRAELTDLLDEVAHLTAVVRKLLLLSQADAGKLELTLEPVNLTRLVEEISEDVHLLAEDRQYTSNLEPNLTVRGDSALLRQLLNNLMSNCVRYSNAGGFIRVTGQEKNRRVELTFANSSRAISESERERFFERFFRGDPSHSRSTAGHGLGLSLALEIAEAHQGTLTIEPTVPHEVCMKLCLPCE